jgi:hypothetical protein
MSGYFNRQGEPMTAAEWGSALNDKSQQRVAETVVNGYWISTVWLGRNHRFGDGPPLIFETMAFPCDESGTVTSWSEADSDRYSTEEEALAGHAAMVEKFTAAKV